MKAQLEAVNANKANVSFENVTANSVAVSTENTSSWLENNGAFVEIYGNVQYVHFPTGH